MSFEKGQLNYNDKTAVYKSAVLSFEKGRNGNRKITLRILNNKRENIR
jgi:hypothetical protein